MSGYKGLAMEGVIPRWYARNTVRDLRRFTRLARRVTEEVPSGSRILEVAPGPGYLAIELARSPYWVTTIDISRSFVAIARANAHQAGVLIDVVHGNAAKMPFASSSFDFAICVAAFKNFTDPVGALDEIHRVLKPNARALIHDLRKDSSLEDIRKEVREMQMGAFNAALTRWIFRSVLLKRAYSREALAALVARSRFAGAAEINDEGIAWELRLTKT